MCVCVCVCSDFPNGQAAGVRKGGKKVEGAFSEKGSNLYPLL